MDADEPARAHANARAVAALRDGRPALARTAAAAIAALAHAILVVVAGRAVGDGAGEDERAVGGQDGEEIGTLRRARAPAGAGVQRELVQAALRLRAVVADAARRDGPLRLAQRVAVGV